MTTKKTKTTKKQSYYQNLCKTYGEIIKKYNFDLNLVHAKLIGCALSGSLSESDIDYLLKNEKDIIESLRAEMSPKKLTRDCLVKAIIEIGGECVKNGELSEESFKVLKESLGIKTKKTRKDFKEQLFKSCMEKVIHKGGNTNYMVSLDDEITDENEEIPDNGTVFAVKNHKVIVFGKDYDEVIVADMIKK